MPKGKKPEVGNTYGRWRVLSFAGTREEIGSRSKKSIWDVMCVLCGHRRVKTTSQINCGVDDLMGPCRHPLKWESAKRERDRRKKQNIRKKSRAQYERESGSKSTGEANHHRRHKYEAHVKDWKYYHKSEKLKQFAKEKLEPSPERLEFENWVKQLGAPYADKSQRPPQRSSITARTFSPAQFP